MAPMTRVRAHSDGTPSDLMAEYYAQRASAGLIIAESTAISAYGVGYFGAPGMYADSHVSGWRKVTEAVHRKGGRIFLQLNHYGRCSSHFMLPGGAQPVSASNVMISRKSRLVTVACPRVTPYDAPRALDTAEVELVVEDFRQATRRAALAGFDGVEIHADSGYLIHQFLSSNVNQRQDKYGGSIPNRAQFLLEILDAAATVRGPEYVGVKLTPGFAFHEIEEDGAEELYAYIAQQLNQRELCFVHMFDGEGLDTELFSLFRSRYQGVVIAEASLDMDQASQACEAETAEMMAFGRLYISNPDLVRRIAMGAELAPYDPETFYTQGAQGYTDYPAAQASQLSGEYDNSDILMKC